MRVKSWRRLQGFPLLRLDDRTEAVVAPTLKAAWLESSYGVERVDVVEHLPVADGARPLVVLAPRRLPHSPSQCP